MREKAGRGCGAAGRGGQGRAGAELRGVPRGERSMPRGAGGLRQGGQPRTGVITEERGRGGSAVQGVPARERQRVSGNGGQSRDTPGRAVAPWLPAQDPRSAQTGTPRCCLGQPPPTEEPTLSGGTPRPAPGPRHPLPPRVTAREGSATPGQEHGAVTPPDRAPVPPAHTCPSTHTLFKPVHTRVPAHTVPRSHRRDPLPVSPHCRARRLPAAGPAMAQPGRGRMLPGREPRERGQRPNSSGQRRQEAPGGL